MRLEDCTLIAGGQTLIKSANVAFPPGKISVLIGGSGTGKSVLLRFLAGLIGDEHESIETTGQIRGHHHDNPRVGIVFQQFALFDEWTPTANVQFAIDHRVQRESETVLTPQQWLEHLGVPPTSPVAVLSGGQKQRLAIARTLAANPDILLYDEPTSGLDAASGAKVAELIRQTQSQFGRTSIVVTHDYETLVPIADELFLLDSDAKTIQTIRREDWSRVAEMMKTSSTTTTSEIAVSPSVPQPQRWLSIGDAFLQRSGKSVWLWGQFWWDLVTRVPNVRWAGRFTLHYLNLVGGVSAWVYLLVAGLIAGFTTTYFTLKFLPFRLYTQPLLIDDLLASIGFALYRILVPVLATILIAARCGAAVAADVGVKQYGGQIDALKTLGVRPAAYLLLPIVVAFIIATPLLETFAFATSAWISRLTFAVSNPDIGVAFWRQHFFRAITDQWTTGLGFGSLLPSWLLGKGFGYVLSKNLICGIGSAAISYYQGITTKHSASEVSHSITATVLWSTLFVLMVHFLIALIEV
ncbi:MAG: ABC transporter permease [Planctomycetota bacterium]